VGKDACGQRVFRTARKLIGGSGQNTLMQGWNQSLTLGGRFCLREGDSGKGWKRRSLSCSSAVGGCRELNLKGQNCFLGRVGRNNFVHPLLIRILNILERGEVICRDLSGGGPEGKYPGISTRP